MHINIFNISRWGHAPSPLPMPTGAHDRSLIWNRLSQYSRQHSSISASSVKAALLRYFAISIGNACFVHLLLRRPWGVISSSQLVHLPTCGCEMSSVPSPRSELRIFRFNFRRFVRVRGGQLRFSLIKTSVSDGRHPFFLRSRLVPQPQ